MKNFLLNNNHGLEIKIFSLTHYLTILLVLFIIVLIIRNSIKLENLSNKDKKFIRYFFGSILLINLIIRRGSFIYYGYYDYNYHLDINFCNFTNIMFIIYCFSGSKKIYNFCFYLTFIGPLMAILFPSVNISPLNYSFYSYIIIHHFVFIFNFIFMYLENKEYNSKDLIKFLIFIIIYFITINIINYVINTYYNLPLDFINDDFLNIGIFKYFSLHNWVTYVVFYGFVIILIIFGNLILIIKTKNLNKKNYFL